MTERKIQNLSICTPQQREAITCSMDPTLVVAGAGSGKTLVLTKRFEYLVNERKIDPTRILLIAFSRKAANNMRKRIFSSNQIDVDRILKDKCRISTFHKFAMEFLEEEFGIKIHLRNIAYEERDKWIFKEVITEQAITTITASNLAWQIMKGIRWNIKRDQRDFTPEDLINIGEKITGFSADVLLNRFPFEDMYKVYRAYDIKMKETGMFSFDDLILNTHIALKNSEEIRKRWGKKFDAILCDEFQDIDDVQFEILKSLSEDEKHIFCVGDPDQSIYGFRNAVPKIFQKFQEYFISNNRTTEIKKLEKNFRSTPEILEVANTLINTGRIEDGFSKVLVSAKAHGPRVTLHISDSKELEEDRIIKEIMYLHEDLHTPLKEMAILARNHSHQEDMMIKLSKKRIPYDNRRMINNSLRSVEIRDLISWLDIALCNDQKVIGKAMKRVINKPLRGIGPVRVEKLFKNGPKIAIKAIKYNEDPKINKFYKDCVKIRNIAQMTEIGVRQRMAKILQECGILRHYENSPSRIKRIKVFLNSVLDQEQTIDGIRDRIMKWTPKSLDGDEITISTIHGVKGLEFKYVFLMKLGEGLIPSKVGLRRAQTPEEIAEYIEEEKRLAYVAVTRAKYGLYLSTSTGEENLSRYVDIVKSLLDPIERTYASDDINDVMETKDDESFEADDELFSEDRLTFDTDEFLLGEKRGAEEEEEEEYFEIEGEGEE